MNLNAKQCAAIQALVDRASKSTNKEYRKLAQDVRLGGDYWKIRAVTGRASARKNNVTSITSDAAWTGAARQRRYINN